MDEWKKYPENLPEKTGDYLVTCQYETKRFVQILEYNEFYKQYDKEGKNFYAPAWPNYELGGKHDDVIAFKKIPEPYSGN